MEKKIFYRYDGYDLLRVEEWTAVRETQHGWWIRPSWGYTDGTHDKFILKDARKRHAQPTKEEALVSYIARKRWQITHLERQLAEAKKGLAHAQMGLVDEKAREAKPKPIEILKRAEDV